MCGLLSTWQQINASCPRKEVFLELLSDAIGAKELILSDSTENSFTAELLITQICLQIGIMTKKWKRRLNSEVLQKLVVLLQCRAWSTAVQTVIIDLLISNSMLKLTPMTFKTGVFSIK